MVLPRLSLKDTSLHLLAEIYLYHKVAAIVLLSILSFRSLLVMDCSIYSIASICT